MRDNNSGAEPSDGAVPQDVLLVEDNILIALDTEDLLRQIGVATVRCARNVAEALTEIAKRAPDFALLDVNLGHETSFDIAWRLRELGIRFAFVTGYGDDVAFAGAFGNVARIRKPYTVETLRAGLSRKPPPD